jgi:hypothetical protein
MAGVRTRQAPDRDQVVLEVASVKGTQGSEFEDGPCDVRTSAETVTVRTTGVPFLSEWVGVSEISCAGRSS